MHFGPRTTWYLEFLAQDRGPLSRWDGMRRVPQADAGLAWLWWGMVIAIIAAVVALIVTVIYKQTRARRERAEFERRGAALGLSNEELKLLRYLARLSGARNSVTVYTSSHLFGLGMARVLHGRKIAALSERMQANLNATFTSLGKKMGFSGHNVDEPTGFSSSREIATGSNILIGPRGSTNLVSGVLTTNAASEFAVQAEGVPDVHPGEVWILRFFTHLSAWEIETRALRGEDGKVVLEHTDNVRRINLRRYPRAATHRRALVAHFPFHGEDPSEEYPQFHPVRVTEIAGPGMTLQFAPELEVGDKVLLVVELDKGRIIRGPGKVRRLFTARTGGSCVAVELVGLDANDLAELSRETNLALTGKTSDRPPAEKVSA